MLITSTWQTLTQIQVQQSPEATVTLHLCWWRNVPGKERIKNKEKQVGHILKCCSWWPPLWYEPSWGKSRWRFSPGITRSLQTGVILWVPKPLHFILLLLGSPLGSPCLRLLPCLFSYLSDSSVILKSKGYHNKVRIVLPTRR